MNLPLTVSYASKTVNADGTISLTAVLKDSTGATLSSTSNIFGADVPAADVVRWMKVLVSDYATANFAASDLPASLSIQFGFPAAVRPLDLIVQ